MHQQCPQCGHPARPGAKFCSKCGQPLSSVAPASDQPLELSATNDVVRAMSAGEILASSWRLFRRYWLRLLLASLVGYALYLIMTIVLLVVLVAPILWIADTGNPLAYALAALVIGLPVAIVNAPLTLAVSSLVLAGRVSYANLWASVFGRRLVFLLLTVALQSLLVFLGSLLLIIPGIYLAVAFSMTPAVVMLEERAGWAALRRSRDLVRGYWWKTLGLLLVSLLIPVAVFVAAMAAVVLFLGGSNTGQLILVALLLLLTVAAPCFAAVVQVLLYYDLRSRRGNFSVKTLLTIPTLRPIFERI